MSLFSNIWGTTKRNFIYRAEYRKIRKVDVARYNSQEKVEPPFLLINKKSGVCTRNTNERAIVPEKSGLRRRCVERPRRQIVLSKITFWGGERINFHFSNGTESGLGRVTATFQLRGPFTSPIPVGYVLASAQEIKETYWIFLC